MTANGYTGAPVGISDVDGLQTQLDTLDAMGTDAQEANYVGWTFDPATSVQAGTALATAGVGYVARVKAMSTVVTNIVIYLTAGGTGLTAGQCLATLHNSAGAQIGAGAITGDQSTAWATSGLKVMPLTVQQGVDLYADYLVRLWFNGSGGPSLAGASNVHADLTNAGLSSPNFRFFTADSGLTTAAAALAGFQNIGAQTAHAAANWVALS